MPVTADITLVNLNMLFMRYGEEVERELHVPLGPLYLARALEVAHAAAAGGGSASPGGVGNRK